MSKVVKTLFRAASLPFGLVGLGIAETGIKVFGGGEAKGATEAEKLVQEQARAKESQRQAELLSEATSRKTGRGRRVGRELLAFAGSKANGGGAASARPSPPPRSSVSRSFTG